MVASSCMNKDASNISRLTSSPGAEHLASVRCCILRRVGCHFPLGCTGTRQKSQSQCRECSTMREERKIRRGDSQRSSLVGTRPIPKACRTLYYFADGCAANRCRSYYSRAPDERASVRRDDSGKPVCDQRDLELIRDIGWPSSSGSAQPEDAYLDAFQACWTCWARRPV